MTLVGFPHSGSQVAHFPLLYLLQGEAGVSGLPGGIGLRGPPVSDCPTVWPLFEYTKP